MYAIIQNGAHQYKVKAGAFLRVEKRKEAQGETSSFDKVLAFSNKEGDLSVGTPYVKGARVHFQIIRHGKSKKTLVFKKNRRKGYRRTKGHRQEFTEIYIESLSSATGQKESLPLKKKAGPKTTEKPDQPKIASPTVAKAPATSSNKEQSPSQQKTTPSTVAKTPVASSNKEPEKKTEPLNPLTKQKSSQETKPEKKGV